MGSFPNSKGYEYILVAVDYVSKWVKALPLELPMLCTRRGCSMKSSFRGTESQDKSLVMEDHTLLIEHSIKLSRKLELITRLPLHITLR
jgi:hypothetical protein